MTLGAVRTEIERLHRFFEDWFTGGDGHSITEFSDCLDTQFFIVSPSAETLDKETIVAGVVAHFGQGRVEITIENVSVAREDRGLIVATYEEHQHRQGQRTVRVSTVGMAADADTPGGYRWLFVHETWLVPPSDA
ncbi:MAG: hypothetical protein BMS9Abin12_1168 [Acidimicrobiia bacterium]|nr:MAG: hypothetical protein BMS9Abin12_1168 [Acidimicrobiia bacterium]